MRGHFKQELEQKKKTLLLLLDIVSHFDSVALLLYVKNVFISLLFLFI